jgi:hypothetical protein
MKSPNCRILVEQMKLQGAVNGHVDNLIVF